MGFLKKIFRSRFFIIALCAAFLLSIVPTVLTAMGEGAYVRRGIQLIATPFQWCFTKIGTGISGYARYFKTVDALRRENEELRAELENNSARMYNAELLEDENNFLRSYLGMKAENSSFEFTDATVIGREATNYRKVYTLSKGSIHGVEKNMPVVTENGLVGYITEVGTTWSRAVAVTETDASVGAYIERSGVLGIVEGTCELRSENMCRITRLDAEADVREGDRVITSGVGSIYPRGLAIGEVTEISFDEYNRCMVATVKPYTDFSALTKVMIITEYTIDAGGSTQ